MIAKDGCSYERAPFETWYGEYKSSPLTGLPMRSDYRRNHRLLKRIQEWASGRNLDLKRTIPAKRKSDAMDDAWKLRVCYGLGSYQWIVELPPDRPLSFLTELAFRCLNTKVPTAITDISLYHGNTRLSSDRTELNSTAIRDGDTLRVETTAPLKPVEPSLKLYDSVSCLIKVYCGSEDRAKVCFLVPKDTEASLLSILIRYRHWSDSDLTAEAVSLSDLELWTPDTESEALLKGYHPLKSSSSLRDVIQEYAVEGWLENDPILEKPLSRQGTILTWPGGSESRCDFD